MMAGDYLFLDRILFPVTSLGPGRRIALWVSGCGRRCFRCANPELWEQRPDQRITVGSVIAALDRIIAEKKPDGLTISGGEPFDQADALTALLDGLSEPPKDILVYSGYRRDDLERNSSQSALLLRASVLIDGVYVNELNEPSLTLRGSSNQQIWFLDPEKKELYEQYMRLGRQIQNYVYDYRILSIGIHSPCRSEPTGEDYGQTEGE